MKFKNKQKGFTLLEVFIVTSVALLFFVIVIGIIQLSGKGTIRALNSSIIQADIRRANVDILKNLNATTWDNFIDSNPKGIYYFGNDSRHPLLIQSALNDDGTIYTDKDMIPHLKKYVLYFIIRPADDKCLPNNPIPNPDVYCPHKLLIKKEINPIAFNWYPTIVPQMLESFLTYDLKNTIYGSILSQKILAENIIDFTITPPAEAPAGSGSVINYNGSAKNVVNKILICNIAAFKDKKYYLRSYSNENLLIEKENLFSLTSNAEPKN